MFEELKGKKFGVIYADPPWRYEFSKKKSDSIEAHYPTMSLDELMAMEVDKICEKNCMLWLWATAPKLEEAFQVIDAWGFNYVTSAVWDKKSIGTGFWFRGQHENLLLSRKGKVSPPTSDIRISSVISGKKTSKHSEKPKIHHIIDSYHPDLAKVELFARDRDLFMGEWEVWGNEV